MAFELLPKEEKDMFPGIKKKMAMPFPVLRKENGQCCFLVVYAKIVAVKTLVVVVS